jgi:glucose-1-phosphate thymidylyltransferase
MEFVGIIPAAGVASRLRPSRSPKELLPVAYMVDETVGCATPVPVISLSLSALALAGVTRTMVIVSDRKPDLFGYLGDGSEFGLNIAYVQQVIPTGLLAAVVSTYEWCGGSHCCLVLPDTIVHPRNSLSSVAHLLEKENLDLVLGVFPTNTPERLGPVRFTAEGTILEVLDKPVVTELQNTWAIAAWSPKFFDLARRVMVSCAGEQPPLGTVFEMAVRNGLRCKAVFFEQGSFIDIGTAEGLSRMKDLQGALFGVRTMPNSDSPYNRSGKTT